MKQTIPRRNQQRPVLLGVADHVTPVLPRSCSTLLVGAGMTGSEGEGEYWPSIRRYDQIFSRDLMAKIGEERAKRLFIGYSILSGGRWMSPISPSPIARFPNATPGGNSPWGTLISGMLDDSLKFSE